MKLVPTEIYAFVEKRLDLFKRGRTFLERLWYLSLLFSRGEQWVTLDSTNLQYRRSNQRRLVPRPTTNKYAATCNAIISSISRFDPKIVMAPQTDSLEDLQTAWASNRVIKSLENKVGWVALRAEFLPWLVYTGNAFLVSGVDKTIGQEVTRLYLQCPLCGENTSQPQSAPQPDCPECAKSNLKSPMMPQLDGRTNSVMTSTERTGGIKTDIATPFEMFFDNRITPLEGHQMIIRIHSKDVDWCKQRYPAFADKIKPYRNLALNTRVINSLASVASSTGMQTLPDESVDITEVWQKPCPEYPKGFYAVMVGERVIPVLQDYPFISIKGEAFFPITHFVYERAPGGLLGRTPAFDLIEKQKTRNRVEALGEMILMRMSNPTWLLPKPGTAVDPSGIPGQKIEYDPHLTAGAKPEKIESSLMPNGITLWMQMIDRDFAELSAQYEVNRGERPLNVRSGYQTQQLKDITADRATALFTNYALGVESWQRQVFELFRLSASDEEYFRVLNEDASWTVSKVKLADLQGGVDVFMEPGASPPKSAIERLAILESLVGMGAIQIQDPLQQIKILREYGVSDIIPGLDADEKQLAREHDNWKRGNEIKVADFDNHAFHINGHQNKMKGEEFESEKADKQILLFDHLKEHFQAYQLQQQQQAQAQGQQATAAQPAAPAKQG